MGEKKFDISVYGATGFTGLRVAKEIASLPQNPNFKWSICGRNEKKLQELSDSLQFHKDCPKPSLIVADVEKNLPELENFIKQSKVLINCVGPFRYWGETVVKFCVQYHTNYVDINGETEFLERMFSIYNQTAIDNKVTIVSCCGFDCVPSDLGVVYLKKEYAKRGFTCSTAELYLTFESGPKGAGINFATYESLIMSFAHVEDLRSLRKSQKLEPLPRVGGERLQVFKNPRYSDLVKLYCIPFPAADVSVVRFGQGLTYKLKNSLSSPVQFSAYYGVKSFISHIGVILFGLMVGSLSGFSIGRKLLLQFPEFFSFGVFKKKGPTQEQIDGCSFVSKFFSRGYKSIADGEFKKPDVEIVATVSGPEMGYVTTPICVVQCAYTFLNDESSKIPYGVHTPASSFGETSIINRLDSRGVKFNIISEKIL